jgi:hypothetical protein
MELGVKINKAVESDYEGFCTHLEEYEEKGISVGFKDPIRLAKQYNCEIPHNTVDFRIYDKD